MPRHDGAKGTYHSTRQKGHSRKGKRRGPYSLRGKARWAMKYLNTPPWFTRG